MSMEVFMKNIFCAMLTILIAVSLFACSFEVSLPQDSGSEETLPTFDSTIPSETPQETEESITPPVVNPSAEQSTPQAANTEWKEFLKEYEAWVDDYITFIKKYQANPTDFSLLADYAKMTSKAVEWSEKADQIQGDLSGADLQEYLETLARITNKLSTLAL